MHVNDANADVVAVLAGNVERHSRGTQVSEDEEKKGTAEDAEMKGEKGKGGSARYRITQDDAHAVLLEAALTKEYFDIVDCDSFGLAGRTISAALQVCVHFVCFIELIFSLILSLFLAFPLPLSHSLAHVTKQSAPRSHRL